jgi:lipoate-protein ligase A
MPVAVATIADEHAWCAAALADAAGVGRARWRVWLYRTPEIVLGCSQRALHDAVARRAPAGVAVSVRPSGGGAVYAGPWMVGASVVLPPDHRLLGTGLVASYRWLGQLHVGLLREAGIEARALEPPVPRTPAPPNTPAAGHVPALAPAWNGPDGADALRWACFGALSPWEVVDAAGRKLTGLAQQRRRSGVAYSAGTLVARSDWTVLCRALDRPDDAAALAARTVACDDVPAAQRRSAADWARRLDAALGEALSAPPD